MSVPRPVPRVVHRRAAASSAAGNRLLYRRPIAPDTPCPRATRPAGLRIKKSCTSGLFGPPIVILGIDFRRDDSYPPVQPVLALTTLRNSISPAHREWAYDSYI